MGYSQVEEYLEQHKNLETHEQESNKRKRGTKCWEDTVPTKDTNYKAGGKGIRVDLQTQEASFQMIFLLFRYFQFYLLHSRIDHKRVNSVFILFMKPFTRTLLNVPSI